MSYILDALRKSEQERLRGQPLSTLSHSPSRQANNTRPAWLLPLLVGNLMVFTVLGVWWLRSMSSSPDAEIPTASNVGQPMAVQVTRNGSGGNATSVPAKPLAAHERAAAHDTQAGDLPFADPHGAEPEYVPLPQTRRSADAASDPQLSNADYEAVGDWHSGADDMPQLSVTSHVYSSDRRARNIIINGTRLREGDQLDNGVRVVEITPTGARVTYKGAEQELEIGR